MLGATVILSGMIAATPGQGGATWAILQYLLGLRRLGCDVVFVEPLDLSNRKATVGVRYCRDVMEQFGFADRWALVTTDGGDSVGLSRRKLRSMSAAADLLINVAGRLADDELLDAIDRRVYLDLDPGFVQLWHAVERIDMKLGNHTDFVTLADTIGHSDCPIPTCDRSWMPTLPPVVLEEWPVAGPTERDAFTTIAHWRGYGSIEHDGIHYGQKAHSWRLFMDLPESTAERFEPALAIDPGEVTDLRALRRHGWHLLDPMLVAATPGDYRRFVQGSRAELGVAKSGYVVSGSGWFSDRSACYLASGRPVLAQDTGFGRRLPVGAGLFPFSETADVVAAIKELQDDYPRHRAAARQLAEQFLDSDTVLGTLIDRLSL